MECPIRYVFHIAICTFMIFFLHPTSGEIHMRSFRSLPLSGPLSDIFSPWFPEENFLNTNRNDDNTKKAISAERNDDGSYKITSPETQIRVPKEMLDQIVDTIKRERATLKAPTPTDVSDKLYRIKDMGPTTSDIFNSLKKSIKAKSKDGSLPTPSPTPAPSTIDQGDESNAPEDDSDSNDTPQPTMKTKIRVKMSMNNKGGDDSDDIKPLPMPSAHHGHSDEPTKSMDSHINRMWTSTLPIFMRNNKASVFSKPDFDDMFKVLPDLPAFMQTLHEVHKPGHVTIMMMNPKHMPVDKEAVKNSPICCEMRQQLLHVMTPPSPPHIDDAPSTSADDDIPPALQSFLNSLLQSQTPEEDAVPTFSDDHQDLNDAPWNDDEKSLISHIVNNLPLFDDPGHLSAVSFHPRQIVQKKNPHLLHIKVRIQMTPMNDESGSDSPLFNSINEPKGHDTSDDDDDMSSLASLLSQSLFNEPDQGEMQMKVFNNNGVQVRAYPLHKLSNYNSLPVPSPPQPIETPAKKATIFYMIRHHHPETPKQTSLFNLQSLLDEIFKLPVHQDYPDWFSPKDDSAISRNVAHTKDPLREILSQILSSNAASEVYPHFESLQAPPLEKSEDETSPLDLLKQLGINLFPQDQAEQILPEDNEVAGKTFQFPIHITRMRLISPSDDDNALERFLG